MVQSVELLLDAGGERAVRREWDLLIASGLPSQGRITAVSNRPHVTIAVAQRIDRDCEDALAEAAAGLAGELPNGLVLGGLVVFPGRRTILARSVAPTAALLRVQQRLSAVLARFGPVPESMRPGRWTPHVTLARGLAGAQLGPAVELVGGRQIDTAWVAVRRWDGATRREWIIAGSGPE